MEVLKVLIITVLVVAFVRGADDEITHRKGRCGSMKGRNNFKGKPYRHQVFPHEGHVFHANSGKPVPPIPLSSNSNNVLVSSDSNAAIGADVVGREEENIDAAASGGNEFGLDVRHDFSNKESPRIRISEDGEMTLGRSMNFRRKFHEDEHEHEHTDHDDEENDHFHKTRHAREIKSDPQELAVTIGGLAQSLSSVEVANSANAGDYNQMSATGTNILFQNLGASQASGSGTSVASGTTNVTSTGGSGWSSRL